MTFREEEVQPFLALFEEVKEKIRNFEGCEHLELWQEKNKPNVMFTYSKWGQEDHLESYRNSELFKDTWMKTKAKFGDKPEAWSVEQLVSSDNNIFR